MDHLLPRVPESDAPEPASIVHATASVGAEANTYYGHVTVKAPQISGHLRATTDGELADSSRVAVTNGNRLSAYYAPAAFVKIGNKGSIDATTAEFLAAGDRGNPAHRPEGREDIGDAPNSARDQGAGRGDAAGGHATGAASAREALTSLLALASPADAQIIAAGIHVGMRPDRGTAIAGFHDPLGIHWRRFRAACARAEMALHAGNERMLSYLRARASQADNEASFAEAALARMDAA